MEDQEVSSEAIKGTQKLLTKYIKKPPLTEKLLRKPPFRFLHDIVTSVIKETGFLKGLFTADEMNPDKVKDKDAKIAFLNKLLNALALATGEELNVRPTKIVAGLEVNKTLEMLQAIGRALDNKIDTTSVVEQVLKSDSKSQEKSSKSKETSKKPALEPKKQEPITNRKNRSESNETKKPAVPKSVPKTTVTSDKTRSSIPKPKTEPSRKIEQRNVLSRQAPTKMKSDLQANKRPEKKTGTQKPGTSPSSKPAVASFEQEKEETLKASVRELEETVPVLEDGKSEEKDEPPQVKHEVLDVPVTDQKVLPDENETKGVDTSSKRKESLESSEDASSGRKKTERQSRKTEVPVAGPVHETRDKHREKTSRPHSARPGSRKPHTKKVNEDSKQPSKQPAASSVIKGTNEDNQRPGSSVRPRTATRPPSARPGAPRIRDRGEVQVVEESKAPVTPVNVIEEDSAELQQDEKDTFVTIETPTSAPEDTSFTFSLRPAVINDEEQGTLVQQILETQKELEGSAGDASQTRRLDIEWESGRQRGREMTIKEVEKIRSTIQTLTGAANPLGRLMEYLREDVEEMQKELQHWTKRNEELKKQYQAELQMNRSSLEPLQKQLEEVEANIQLEYSRISSIKATILNNDKKILNFMSGLKSTTRR